MTVIRQNRAAMMLPWVLDGHGCSAQDPCFRLAMLVITQVIPDQKMILVAPWQ
jgi:hypothetical protein